MNGPVNPQGIADFGALLAILSRDPEDESLDHDIDAFLDLMSVNRSRLLAIGGAQVAIQLIVAAAHVAESRGITVNELTDAIEERMTGGVMTLSGQEREGLTRLAQTIALKGAVGA